MFKTLKKKMEDVGADLSAVGSSGTRGSSLSSLRGSGSRTSGLSVSRESLQSDTPSKVIHTTSPALESLSTSGTLVELPLLSLSETTYDTNIPETTAVADFPLDFTARNESDLLGCNYPVSDTLSGELSYTSVSLVDERMHEPGQTPVLLPRSIEHSSAIAQDSFHSISPALLSYQENLLRDIDSLKLQLVQKEQEDKTTKSQLSSKDMENLKLKAEIERYKDLMAKNKANDERLQDSLQKMADLHEQLESVRLERDSWKIAHDQKDKKAKEKDSLTATLQKKVSDLDSKLSMTKVAITDQKQEIEKFREENMSVKAAVNTLDNQIDKLLEDLQKERISKEEAQSQSRMMEEAAMKDKLASEHVIASLQQDIASRDQELADVRQDMDVVSQRVKKFNWQRIKDLEAVIEERESEANGLRRSLLDKVSTEDRLRNTVSDLEAKIRSLEEDVEGKESALAIFRRRSAKDTESKLRERDRQIANLERQMTDLSEKVTKVVSADYTDRTSTEYMKNVVLKFVTGTAEEALQLIRAVSVLLKLTEEEESWLREISVWKQSWLPGPKPELPHHSRLRNGST